MFPRQELRETSGHFLDGLLSGIERKTGWLMAEQAGLARRYRMQSLLGRSQWNEDGLRDAVRAYVIEALGDADGVLIVDEGSSKYSGHGRLHYQRGHVLRGALFVVKSILVEEPLEADSIKTPELRR